MKTIHELALESITEIDRRGWYQGTLGLIRWYQRATDTYIDVAKEDCKVCAIGAMSSAYNNFDPFKPGYNDADWVYEDENDNVGRHVGADVDYQTFMDAVLDMINQTHPDTIEGRWTSVAYFNDRDETTEEMVRDIFQKVADKYAPAVADAPAA